MLDSLFAWLDLLPREKMAFAFGGCTPIEVSWIRSLSVREPHLEELLTECDTVLAEETGWSLKGRLAAFPQDAVVTRASLLFPLQVSLQIALFRLLRHYGFDAGNVIGLSIGEVAAAYAAGALDLREALQVAVLTGRLLEPDAEGCRMAFLWLSAPECAQAIAPFGDRISIGCLLAPELTVVSGERSAVAALLRDLSNAGYKTQPVPLPWGFHSCLLREGCATFEAAMAPIPRRDTQRRLFSTCRGDWMEAGFDATHWSQLAMSPSQLMPGVQRMQQDGVRLFLEVGRAGTMQSLISRIGGRAVALPNALAAAREAAGRPEPRGAACPVLPRAGQRTPTP
ncbi:MAG: acyltransferase domain-containing protein [Armatimonadetes bacterium]|nr:acyltransferase domain-containing protein [Armatimonadota bacterium]